MNTIKTTNTCLEAIEMHRIENLSSGHFFDKASMRFFNSRLAQYGYRGPGGTFFVTSEKFRNDPTGKAHPRLYSVRELMLDGSVKTRGEFQGYKTSKTADKYARLFAAGK